VVPDIDKLSGNVCAIFPSQGALVDTLLAISVLGVLKTDTAYHVFYGFAKQLGGFLTAGGADVVLVPGQCVDVQRGALLIALRCKKNRRPPAHNGTALFENI
jgi:hypothetical protein